MKETIKEIFSRCGIRDIGFCDFGWAKEHLLECRAKARLPQGAKTVIMCAFPYKVEQNPPKNISRYASVPDYHTVCGEMLARAVEALKQAFPQNQFEYFIDNSPIPEVSAAAAAGLGVKGDNGLLITPQYGSFVFLGEVVCDLKIECENLYAECSHCGKCKTACPVNCDKKLCLSSLSQKKGELTGAERAALIENKILWGCDICAECCPYNAGAKSTYIKEFCVGYRDFYQSGENPQNRAYNWRKGAIERNAQLTIKKHTNCALTARRKDD